MSNSDTPIRLGVIGLSTSPGGWATNLLSGILTPSSSLAAKYRITALATRSAGSAADAAKKYSEQLGYAVKAYHGPAGSKELAQDPNVDVVVVVVKVSDHKAAVLPAIEAGKDVFVEWPLGKNLDEAKEIVEKAQAKGVRGIVGTQGVHIPWIKKIKEVIESGGIGKVVSTSLGAVISNNGAAFSASKLPERYVYTTEAESGATATTIVGGHFLACLTYILGDFASLSSTFARLYPRLEVFGDDHKPTGKFVERKNEDQVAFSGTLKSGATATFHLRTVLPNDRPGRTPFRWVIDGEEGTIEIIADIPLPTIAPPSQVLINGQPYKFETEYNYLTGPLDAAWEEFAKGKEGKYTTFEDALRLHHVVDAINSSAKNGVRVSLD